MESVIGEKRVPGLGTQFLVKWKGYPKSEASWEPAAHCSGCPELVEQFRRSKAARSRFTTRPVGANAFYLEKSFCLVD